MRVALDEVADSITYGVTASAINQPVGPKFLRITDIQDSRVNWEDVPWCDCNPKARKSAQLRSGDIVFARTGATTGKSYLIADCPVDSVFASYLIRVRLRDTVHPAYVSHFFSSQDYWSQVAKSSRGAAQPGINASTLKTLQIPLPPLAEQKRIAEILDAADALRAKRRESIAQLDALLQSTFLEMFGDPVTNPKGWEMCTLDDVATRITDGTHKTPRYTQHGIEFISAKDIKNGAIQWGTGKYISQEEHAQLIKRCNPDLGDVVLAKSGSLGAAALIDSDHEFSMFESLCLIKLDNEKVDPYYLVSLIQAPSLQSLLLRSNKGVGVKHLHLVDIRKLRITLPPLEIQHAYKLIVLKLDRLKKLSQEYLVEQEILFSSLQHRAFNGEL